jgi:hypothetical protein
VNNAFIAYRNAYEVYQNDYAKNLGTEPPLQLKKDLLRTAYQNGFYSELDIFEKEFGMKYDPKEKTTSDMVCFWNKDLCPIKIPYSIDFLITDMGNGYLLFTNLELGYSIPIYIGDKSADKDKIIKMKIIRVAIPKLESRKPKYINASIENGNTIYPFELTENIDAIAFLSLKDRMEKELAETLLRFSLKRITEMEARKESVWIGIAVNIFNAMTEQADTRIWQMLPQSINYTRVNLMEGENNYTFHLKGYNSTTTDSICIESKTKTTYFKTFVNY